MIEIEVEVDETVKDAEAEEKIKEIELKVAAFASAVISSKSIDELQFHHHWADLSHDPGEASLPCGLPLLPASAPYQCARSSNRKRAFKCRRPPLPPAWRIRLDATAAAAVPASWGGPGLLNVIKKGDASLEHNTFYPD